MARPLLIACLAAALLASPAAAQQGTLLMPGVSYERKVEFTLHGPVVVNVIEAPRPTGLYALQPVLAKGSVQGREKVTAIERRLSSTATVAAVNGDLSSAGRPSGLFLQGSVIQTQPLGSRSSLGVDPSGSLAVDRIPFVAEWRGSGPRRNLSGMNQAAGPNGTILFTPAWAGPTPAAPDAVEVVFGSFPSTVANVLLAGVVTDIHRGGNTPVPPGGAILYARGNAATRLAAETIAGGSVIIRLTLPSPLSAATEGIGGGPLLVRNGRPVFRANEAFGSSWLVSRTARTGVGQRADGSVLLVAVDGGRPGYSMGMSNFELAQELSGLGAVTAMALDSGSSTAMAFDGRLLNRPSQGEQPVADALALLYTGVQAPPPSEDVLVPGATGSGLAVEYKLARPSTVTAALVGPGGARTVLDEAQHPSGTYDFTWQGTGAPEGRWTWSVTATDDLGRTSKAERAFSVNSTLQRLAVEQSKITVDLARAANLTIRIERSGTVLRTLLKKQADAGTATVTWDGRLDGGILAARGTYTVRATATNQIGTAELTAAIKR